MDATLVGLVCGTASGNHWPIGDSQDRVYMKRAHRAKVTPPPLCRTRHDRVWHIPDPMSVEPSLVHSGSASSVPLTPENWSRT